ncbi:lipid asymmetry maintenance protein MlaB [Massilia sp. ZL223]|jgi:phospholipid transport system transporter-binding protein|uniref:STAS domain-containing protein n=2 Tax=unclassified Massilia TaxID=2609279 RepID=UPI001B815195|nr:STAS domain-containing protein [Massilia sp. ZL223]MBQ5938682.1 STAS domain-containing protein [Massilia sp. AB1]MBQ5962147.1 STAS domain-containing protein [Massilia sp. ZL223]
MAEANAMLSLDALTFQSARAALEQGALAIKAGETVFDLAGIQAADSSGVAMLLAWQRRAQAAGQRLRFINMPDNVRKLAALYGVDSLLPQQ